MGEIINGVYVPSNEDLLQHYGKKRYEVEEA